MAEPERERAVGSWAWKAAAAAGVLGAAASGALAAHGTDATGLIGALQLGAACAVGAGARLHRPAHPLPWWLLAGGLALNGARRVAVATLGTSAAVEGFVAVAHPVSLMLYVATLVAVLVLRARRRPREQLLDAAIVTLAVGLVAVEAVRLLVTAPVNPPASVLPGMLVVGLGVALVAATLHLIHTDVRASQPARGHVVLGLLAGAVTVRLGRDLLAVSGFDSDGLLTAGLTPIALGLVAGAMLHPAGPWLVQPARDRLAPSNARQLAAFAGALLVLPLLATTLMLGGADLGVWVPLTVVGMVALTGLVAVRLQWLLGSLRTTTALRHVEARQDVSTGLPNTRGLFDDLVARAERRRPEPVGVLVVSLVGVGEAGSVHGLGASAGLLEQLAERLDGVLPPDASVGVLPGGDLAAVVTVASEEQLDALGWRVRELTNHALVVGGVPLTCRASVGLAVREPDETPAAVVRRADLASRWAERVGAEGVQRYDAAMDVAVAYEMAVRTDIRDAIRRDDLLVWCQPQLDTSSGEMVGVECLARWRHPTYGWVPPAEFVPAARDVGVAAELDARMVHRVAQQAAAWRAAGLAIPRVAVNVEPTSLSDPAFLPAVSTALRSAQLPPGSLEIELTEAVTAYDQTHARDVLWQLRAMGVSLAVDDFGTGYSSLAALHHLPMDAIKLDRELVSILVDDPVLVGATITLVQRLGLRLVAEGVETPTELALLEQAGCRVAQGYLLAEPMPTEELIAWHARRTTCPPTRV